MLPDSESTPRPDPPEGPERPAADAGGAGVHRPEGPLPKLSAKGTGPIAPGDGVALRRELRRLQMDLDTLVEATQQMNLRSLDLDRLERYATSLFMGQFGAFRIAVLRRLAPEDERIVPTLVRNLDIPRTFSLDPQAPLVRYLKARAGPMELAATTAGETAAVALSEAGVRMLVPLIKRDIEGARDLVGLVCIGARIGERAFEDVEMRLLGLMADMLAISLHNAQLHHRSIFDALTKIYSRGHFDLQLAQEIERTRRRRLDQATVQAGKNLSLLMIDIDHFKEFNDHYGHPLGDDALRGIAQAIRAATRTSDVVARYGGEEFAVILPETEAPEATRIAERIRERVAALDLGATVPAGVRITVSLGVANYPQHASDGLALVREADKALYRAKEAGRNKVVVAG